MKARRRKSLEAPFLVTFAAVTVVARGGKLEASAADLPQASSERAASCPATAPEDGESCGAEDEGLACEGIDACNAAGVAPARTMTCANGRWSGPARTYRVACPGELPDVGDSCATCVGAYPPVCNYGRTSCGLMATATCDTTTGRWLVSNMTCNPPPPPRDAGTDGP